MSSWLHAKCPIAWWVSNATFTRTDVRGRGRAGSDKPYTCMVSRHAAGQVLALHTVVVGQMQERPLGAGARGVPPSINGIPLNTQFSAALSSSIACISADAACDTSQIAIAVDLAAGRLMCVICRGRGGHGLRHRTRNLWWAKGPAAQGGKLGDGSLQQLVGCWWHAMHLSPLS
jgi:hypothetical protein